MGIYALIPLALVLIGGLCGFRVYGWLRRIFPGIRKQYFWPIYSLNLISVVGIGSIEGLPRLLKAICAYWFSVYAIFCAVIFLSFMIDLIFWVVKKIRRGAITPSPRAVLAAGLAVIVLASSLSVYGIAHAVAIKEQTYNITLPTAEDAGSLRVALVSDIHLGNVIGLNRVRRMVEKINAMDADIICIAGDFLDGGAEAVPEEVWQALDGLSARYGVYAVLGNHDRRAADFLAERFDGTHIKLLLDEAVTIDGRFTLVGRRDRGWDNSSRMPLADILAKAENPGLPVMVLDHQPQPQHVDEAKETGALLMLSGHTHQGQIFPLNLITDAAYPLDYGYANLDGLHLVVSSGAGTWGPPIRFGTDSEVVLIIIE